MDTHETRRTRDVRVAPRTIFLLVAVAVGAVLLLGLTFAVRAILVQLVVAIVLAMALEPLVSALERRGLRRGAATGVTFALVVMLLIAVVYTVARPLADETSRLVHNSPQLLDQLSHGRGRFGFLEQRFSIVERMQSAVDSGKFSTTGGAAWSVIRSGLHSGGQMVFVLFLTLFVQLGGRQWYDSLVDLVPTQGKRRVRRTGEGIAEAVGGYVVGNLAISAIAGTVAAAVLFATGVPYPLPLGLIVAILDLIPLVGATLATVLVAAVALTSNGWITAAIVVAALVVYQQIENNVLQQIVYHRTVKLSPLAIALSVAAGAQLAGVVGALLAIPFAAALKVVARELIAWRRGDDAPAETSITETAERRRPLGLRVQPARRSPETPA
ncbi:MAG TPA: AI-2E family transporter [Gaiellaceae bacterium]|jgi:predicted PurR-regulated permease PerM